MPKIKLENGSTIKISQDGMILYQADWEDDRPYNCNDLSLILDIDDNKFAKFNNDGGINVEREGFSYYYEVIYDPQD